MLYTEALREMSSERFAYLVRNMSVLDREEQQELEQQMLLQTLLAIEFQLSELVRLAREKGEAPWH